MTIGRPGPVPGDRGDRGHSLPGRRFDGSDRRGARVCAEPG